MRDSNISGLIHHSHTLSLLQYNQPHRFETKQFVLTPVFIVTICSSSRSVHGVSGYPNGIYLWRWKWGLHQLVEQEGYSGWIMVGAGGGRVSAWHLWKRGRPDVEERGHLLLALEWCLHVEMEVL